MGPSPSAASSVEEPLFLDRVERKFFVRRDQGEQVLAAMSEHLRPHRFSGRGANRLPRPSHFIASLYFDNAHGDVAAARERGDPGAQIRAREYYDEHADLAELATSAEDLVAASPVLWLEVKQRVEGRIRKLRCGITDEAIPVFLRDGLLTDRIVELSRQRHGDDAAAVLQQIADAAQCHALPLRPACVVHYRRHAWQDDGGTVRVTLDSRLSFFGPPTNVATLRDSVGRPAVAQWPKFVLEIKTVGGVPAWLDALPQQLQLAPARLGGAVFSKFVAASAALRGELKAG